MSEVNFKEDVTIGGLLGEIVTEGKCDTGAKRTSIDMDLAAEIGAGPIVDTKTFTNSNGASYRPIAKIEIEIRGERREVAASIADRSHLSTDVLIGRDVLEGFVVSV